jgi:5-aminolevulinate synthase
LATQSVNGANGLALRAIGCPIMSKAIALRTVEAIRGPKVDQTRAYASQAPREEIDEIHRQHGVQPGARGICPTALDGYNAAQAANKVSATQTAKPADPLLYAAPAQKAFDYDGFYQAELDKKHKDKSYRSVAPGFPTGHA